MIEKERRVGKQIERRKKRSGGGKNVHGIECEGRKGEG